MCSAPWPALEVREVVLDESSGILLWRVVWQCIKRQALPIRCVSLLYVFCGFYPTSNCARLSQQTHFTNKGVGDARFSSDFDVCGPDGLQRIIREQVRFGNGYNTGGVAGEGRAGRIRTLRIGCELATA